MLIANRQLAQFECFPAHQFFPFVFQFLPCFSYQQVRSYFAFRHNSREAGARVEWLSGCAALTVSFLGVSMGPGQQQRSGRGGGGQEHHAPCGFDSRPALPEPSYGVDP